jgi:tyrosine-specific transport protein
MIRENYLAGHEATNALSSVLGSSATTRFGEGFAFFAVITSFLAVGLALTHFLADGFKVAADSKNGKLLAAAAILPPFIFALIQPGLFYKALSFAGGICAMILFGILPVAMIWRGRYNKKLTSNYHAGGGKITLLVTAGFAVLVIVCELARIL